MTSVQTSEPFPLSSLQRAYFTGRQAGLPLHAPARYAMEFRVDALDPARLQGALRLVIERHDALRTIVDARGEGVVRLHVPELAVEERDLRAADDPTAALRRQRDALMEAERPLSSWPLFQVVALRLSDREWRVQFAFELMFMDGVSMTNFFRELSTLYETPQAELDEIGFSLAEHARQRARGTGSARVQRALAYWEERVATLPFGPQLPLRGDAALRTRSRLIRRRAELDETQWAGLREACRKADVSVPAALATAYTDVLGYFGREPRFSVSVMLQQRPPEAALALGSFASTVPLLVDASELDDFGARARSTQRRLTEALMHSDVSGVEIAQRMLRYRSQALTIPFPAAFVATLQPERDEPLRRTPFVMEGAAMVWSELRTPQVVLDHQATETPEGRLRVYWDASEDALCPGVAEDMFSVYLTHLRQLSDAGWGQKRAGVTLPAQQKLQREAVNSTAGERDWRLLHEPFWNQVERRPDRVCLVEGSVRLAYAALGRIVNAGTQRLLASGVQPGDRVALVMHKGWEQIAGALAVLGAGAVYVPIDASAPAAWRCRVLERCGVKMALTQPRTDDVGGWPHAVEHCVLTESVDPAVTLERPLPRARLDDLAYIIFTSGSTGEPKGVMIDHRGAFNTIADINRRFGVSERDAVLGVSSFSFDLSVYDAFGLLAAGGTVVLPPSSAPTPSLWLELLRAEKITVWNSVPALAVALVDYVEALGQKLPDSLRCVLLSGDWIPVSLPGRIARAAANPRIASLGGATEGSIWSVLFPIDARASYMGSVPYGKPLLNQTMHVLDASLRPRPEWVVGDLFIGGVGVAQGYWDDFEKTKASFIEHPSTRERLYRTGDLARYLPDGNLEFLGRLDTQVKVNGFRIELSEIEIALEQHPLVARAVVLAREGAQGSRRLVAWLQASPGEALEISVIEAYLRERLPAYMLPARYCVSTDLPLTPNGKIDRAALEVAPMAADAAESPDAPPSSATEVALAAIWKSLLERGTVSRKQDFFAAGGDSFLAILLLTQIEDVLGVRLGADTLLRSPSLEPLARAIDEARTASSLPTGCCSSLGESGAKAPLYLVHPAGGSAWCFRELAQSLAGSRPVRAFSSPGLADPSPRLETIEEMADRYVAELSSEGADSEFCLGGWSLGGVVAYEMARRLNSRGRLRLPVLLLDAPAPVRHELLSDAAIYTWFARDVLRLSAGNEASNQLPPITTLEELHTLLRGQRGPSISALSPQQLQQMLDVFSTNLRALANYRAPTSRIELAVLRAEEATTPELATHPCRDQPDLGWAMLTGAKTSVRSVPGDHYSMLSGLRASALAASIEDVLGRS